jgi:hypothetical protein
MPASASRASAPANLNGHPGAKGEYGHRRTNTDEIDNTISHPGSVKINVEGAFIVDRDSTSPHRTGIDGVNHETTDIRLPNHTAVVSHIAVDVRPIPNSMWRLASDRIADRGISSEACLLLARTATSETRRTTKLYEF